MRISICVWQVHTPHLQLASRYLRIRSTTEWLPTTPLQPSAASKQPLHRAATSHVSRVTLTPLPPPAAHSCQCSALLQTLVVSVRVATATSIGATLVGELMVLTCGCLAAALRYIANVYDYPFAGVTASRAIRAVVSLISRAVELGVAIGIVWRSITTSPTQN